MNDFEQFSKKKLKKTQKLTDYLRNSLFVGGMTQDQYIIMCEQMGGNRRKSDAQRTINFSL